MQEILYKAVEPDASFIKPTVPFDLAIRDANRTLVPIIVIETALSEDWATMMRSVRTYFDLGVLQVVSFKLSITDDISCIRITQMFRMDFRRPNDYVDGMPIQASHVISFGHELPDFQPNNQFSIILGLMK